MASKAGIKTTFEPEKTIQPIYTGGSVALDATGRILVTCLGEDVVITDLNTGEQLVRVEGDGESITTLALTPSASHLITCSRSLSMRIYSLRPSLASTSRFTVELTRTLKPHSSPVIISAIDRTGTLLATGGADAVVKVWDIRGGYITHTFRGHSGIISALHFFESSSTSRGISNGDSQKGQRKSWSQTDDKIEDPDAVGDGLDRQFRLASGGEDGKVRIWDLRKRKSISVLDSHVAIVRGLDYSTQENALVSASRDKTTILWDASSWKIRRVSPALEGLESVAFLSNGSIIVTGGESGRIRIWETQTGREVTHEQVVGGEDEGIINVIYHDKLPFILSVHADQTLLLHSLAPIGGFVAGASVEPLPLIRRISGTYDEIIDLAYVSPDKSLLALATNSEDIKIVSLATSDSSLEETENDATTGPHYFGADVGLLCGHEDIVICLDVDWSGHWLATGAKDNTARLWRLDPSASSYTCYEVFTGHAESLGAISLPRTAPPIDSAAYCDPLEHPPKFLFTGSQDRTVKRWDVSKMKDYTSLKGHKAPRATYTRKAHDKDINAIDVNYNATMFASASQDRTVKIWSTEEGEVQGVLRGHRRGVWSVRFAPKETPTISGDSGASSGSRGLVLTGSGDKSVKIWSLVDYSCLRTLEGHTNSVLKVIWMNLPKSEVREQCGLQLASAGGDGLVKVWDANSGEVECTLDNHEDRVWALTVHPTTNSIVSGSGDSTVTFWTDTSSATFAATTAASTARVEQDQQLQNYTRVGDYRPAITLALQLNHPARLLALFTSVTNTAPPEDGSLCGVKAVDEVLGTLTEEQLFALLLRVRDWNTNVRTAPVAQRLLWTIVKSYPATTFTDLRKNVKGGVRGESLKEVLEALKAYTQRHYRRIEELVDESYLVEYTLREMDELAFTALRA
ncbi:MAG: U3 small nucleolar RNA-associated protein 13 [Candelina submexicana]|nr:MAG: U3 small nucleolar RNA-associated protein 13 [Candelina submexicana]